jgi:hypothetical protein
LPQEPTSAPERHATRSRPAPGFGPSPIRGTATPLRGGCRVKPPAKTLGCARCYGRWKAPNRAGGSRSTHLRPGLRRRRSAGAAGPPPRRRVIAATERERQVRLVRWLRGELSAAASAPPPQSHRGAARRLGFALRFFSACGCDRALQLAVLVEEVPHGGRLRAAESIDRCKGRQTSRACSRSRRLSGTSSRIIRAPAGRHRRIPLRAGPRHR